MATTKTPETEADAMQLVIAVDRLRCLLQLSTEESTNWTARPSAHEQSKIYSLDYAMSHVIDDIEAQAKAFQGTR